MKLSGISVLDSQIRIPTGFIFRIFRMRITYQIPDQAYFAEEASIMASIVISANFAHQRSHKSHHFHDCHQILYIMKGSAGIEVNGIQHTAKAGDLVLFSRFEQHAVTSSSTDYQRCVLQIAPQAPSNTEVWRKLFSILSNRPVGFSNILPVQDSEQEVLRLLRLMVSEKEHPAPYSDQMLDLLMQELLICIYRHYPDPLSTVDDDCLAIVTQIQSRFESDCQPRYSLTVLAEEYGFSVSYLSHLFKKITGKSVMGYLQSCRIAAAKKYLAETTLGIGRIVELCGFTDSSNFSRTFRRTTGCSPTEFRQSYHESH